MYTTSCTYIGLKNKINLGGVAPRKQKISYVHGWYSFALKTSFILYTYITSMKCHVRKAYVRVLWAHVQKKAQRGRNFGLGKIKEFYGVGRLTGLIVQKTFLRDFTFFMRRLFIQIVCKVTAALSLQPCFKKCSLTSSLSLAIFSS